jgi:hypothetical protein
MALSDILTLPFLVSLGITLVVIGLVGVYFMYKFQEQNHKISSMFGLVTTMAEEMNFMRSKLQQLSYQGPTVAQSTSQHNLESEHLKLIPVSDNEADSESEESEDESYVDSDSESESEPEELEMLNADSINFVELANESNNVKVINFAELLNETDKNDNNDNSEIEDLDDSQELNNDDETDSDSNNEIEEEEIVGNSDVLVQKNNLDFIKTIDISNLAESNETNDSIDYKKMSLNKLKSVAVSKGLLQENSKATKNAILKLLGSE